MMCCSPSGYIIFSLRKLKFYGGRGPDNPNNRFFKHVVTFALDHGNIEKHLERIKRIETFLDLYGWKGIHFSTALKMFDTNNKLSPSMFFFNREIVME